MKIAIAAPSNQQDNIEKIKEYINAAVQIPSEIIELWLIGDCQNIDEYEKLPLDKIYWIKIQPDNALVPHLAAEEILPALEQLYKTNQPDAIFFFGNISGSELAVRLSRRTEGSCITEASFLEQKEKCFYVTRGAYSFNLKAKFEMNQKPYILTLANGAYEPISTTGNPEIVIADFEVNRNVPWSIDREIQNKEEAEGLESAKIIVAVGRGVGSKSSMVHLEELAALLGGKLGGTRPTVLDSWLRMNQMLGSSGNVVKPKLCITLGTSGSGPFLIGIEKSECIIAVNNDPKALIFKESDVGIIDDCNEIAEELIKLLQQEKN